MVLRGGQREGVHSIREDEERGLLPFHELLDHDGAAGLAERVLLEAARDGAVGFLQCPAHEGPLAAGETIGLDHERRPQFTTEAARGRGVREGVKARRRDSVARHQILGKGLRAFDARRRPARSEDPQASLPKAVGEPEGQRQFRPHDGEIDLFARGECHQLLDGRLLHIDALGMMRRSLDSRARR